MPQIIWRDEVSGADARSNAVRELRVALQQALSSPTAPRVNATVTQNALNRELKRIDPTLPGRTVFYNTFALKQVRAPLENIERFLLAAGASPAEAQQAASRCRVVLSGGPKAADAPDPRGVERASSIARQVYELRERWDAGEVGTAAYRNPELALPQDLLVEALGPARAGNLTEEDVAFCVYSAAKHNSPDLPTWMDLVPESESAAEALVDLVLVPTRQMERPGIRAAHAMQRLNDELLSEAAEIGHELSTGRTDGVNDLFAAASERRVPDLVLRRLQDGFYQGEVAHKLRSWLGQLEEASLRRGARGMITGRRASGG